MLKPYCFKPLPAGACCPMTDAQTNALMDLCTRFQVPLYSVAPRPELFSPNGTIVAQVGPIFAGIAADGTVNT